MSELGIVNNIDINSEKNLVSGLLTHGFKAWADIADIIDANTLIADSHQNIYKILDYTFKKHGDIVVDWPTFINGANALGLKEFCDKKDEKKYLKELKENFKIELSNVKILGTKLRKLAITRQLRKEIQKADAELAHINGDERLSEILGKIENPVANFSQYLRGIDHNGPELILKDLGKYLDYLESNPVEQVGVATGFPRWDKSIGGGLIPGSVSLIGARMKTGKALRHGSLVYTINGPKPIETITINDKIITPDNKVSRVIGVFPQGKVKIYRILFNDNSYVDCCENHLWKIKSYKSKHSKIIKTSELIGKNLRTNGTANTNKFSIELTKPIDFSQKKYIIHPYILGVLIGDGSLTHGACFTSVEEDIVHNVKERLLSKYTISYNNQNGKRAATHRIKHISNKCHNIYVTELQKLSLFGKRSIDKFVPIIYKYSTKESRIELIQGLMDTDGYVDYKGNCSYSTVSYQLAKDVQEIIQSLGGKCTIQEKCSTCNNKGFFSYVLNISMNDNSILFKLNRKKQRCIKRTKNNIRRSIQKVEFIGYDYATCISIEDSNGLFLTDNFIVTHNTMLCDNIAFNITSQQIPCLILDAEMVHRQHYTRLLAKVSKVPMSDIRNGNYSHNEILKSKVRTAQKLLENLPYHYLNIAGQEFEETMAEAQRWIMNTVKLNSNGKANPCVIILDYLKTMSSSSISREIKEYQLLGLATAEFINFAIKFDIPCLCFLQLNREGIKNEDTSVFAGSDRIGMSCSNASIFKVHSEEEIEKQREFNRNIVYNRKLLCKFARDGEGHEDGDYINIKFDRPIADMSEGPSLFEMEAQGYVSKNSGVIDDEDEKVEF